ncbi:MAG: outer membrane protein assembly factor BamE [Syntrophobacteraceae bacterium]
MTKRHDAPVILLVCAVLLTAVAGLSACSRNEPPPPPQSGPPAMAVPQAQAPAVQPVPQQQAAPQMQPAPVTSPAQPQMAPSQAAAPPSGQNFGAFAQVHMGMSSQQVLQLLGSPTKVKPKGQYVEWEYWTGGRKFEIKLQADQVVAIENH